MSSKSIAFVGVDVVPMDREGILHDQTVVVTAQRIAALGHRDKIPIPPDTTLVRNCEGKFLMPGLCDMHVHNWTESEFTLFLANGVTTIRNMWGSPRHLAWREKIARGEILAPTIYTAGPLVDGSPPIWSSCRVIDDPEEAREEVLSEKNAGYDFNKVYNRLSARVYESIAAEAKKQGMKFVGHVPYSVGLAKAIESGQASIEHLDGYVDAIQAANSRMTAVRNLESRLRAVEFVDSLKIPAVVKLTVISGVWNCVTLVVNQRALAPPETMRQFVGEDLMRYVPPIWLEEWKSSLDYPTKISKEKIRELFEKRNDLLFELTRALYKQGARILLGTDAPNPFVVPGFSIHEELKNLIVAGLSPYEALRAGTANASEFLGEAREFGTIRPRKRADFILLEKNPLEDVSYLSTERAGVMVRGRWLEESALQTALGQLVQSYHTEAALPSGSHLRTEFPLRDKQEHFLYSIKVGNNPLGQEEVVVLKGTDGKTYSIHSRVALNAPPFVDYFEMLIDLGDNCSTRRFQFRADRSEGPSRLDGVRNGRVLQFQETIAGVRSELSWEKKFEEESPPILGCPWFAGTYFQLPGRELLSLNPAEMRSWELVALNVELGLEVEDSRLEIGYAEETKKEDNAKAGGVKNGSDGNNPVESARELTVKDKRVHATYKGKMRVNEMGVPATLDGPSILYGVNHRLVSFFPKEN